MNEITAQDVERYARQIVLPEVGVAGQQRLKQARVLCIGAGGLGSPVALYLAAGGVGTIGLVDDDRVELSNLHRQLLHSLADVGRDKLESARERLIAINGDVRVELHPLRLDAGNADEMVRGYDIVIDGSDNLETRYASNDACVAAAIPNVYGAISRFEGQVSVFAPHLGTACYRCLFPEPPPPHVVPNCSENGVLGPLPGIVGSMQALETMKLILGMSGTLLGRLLLIDAATMRFREVTLRRDPECRVCATHHADQTAPPPQRAAEFDRMSVQQLHERLLDPALVLVDVREPFERQIAKIDRSIAMPLNEIPARSAELPRDRDLAFICHTGIRSACAAQLLRQRGFEKLWNVEGGIDAWAAEVDPAMPRY